MGSVARAEGAHTPGPWRVCGRANIQAAESVQVASAGFKMGDWPREAYAEEEANAKLIAAAPDLLAACQLAEYAMTGPRGEAVNRNAIDAITRALAKAGVL